MRTAANITFRYCQYLFFELKKPRGAMGPFLGSMLIGVLVQVVPWAQASCGGNVLFLRHHNKALLGHVINTFETSYMTCVEKCAETMICRSVNFCRDKNGKSTCELNESSKTLRPDSIVFNSSCEYDEMTQRDWINKFNSSLFVLIKERKTWNEARMFCQSLQADLVSITSQQEKDFIDSTLLTAAPQGNVTVDTSLLLAFWKLDGTDADREVTLHGNARFKTIDGYKALYLDGKNKSFATTPSIELFSRSFTVGAWIKLVKPASSGLIFGHWSSPYQISVLVHDNGTVSAHIRFASSNQFAHVTYSSIPFNAWVHVMFSWSNTRRALLILINGKEKVRYTVPGNDVLNLVKQTTQGYDIGLNRNRSSVFHGYLRELAIYRRSANGINAAATRFRRWDQFSGVWMGLNDLTNEGSFVYSDGAAVTYTNWEKDEPNDYAFAEDCVTILLSSEKHSWVDQPCGQELPFICRKKE